MKCKCCEKESELRMGICFDCADAESVIKDGVDMFDAPITKLDGYSESMSKLRYILEKYKIVKKQNQ